MLVLVGFFANLRFLGSPFQTRQGWELFVTLGAPVIVIAP